MGVASKTVGCYQGGLLHLGVVGGGTESDRGYGGPCVPRLEHNQLERVKSQHTMPHPRSS